MLLCSIHDERFASIAVTEADRSQLPMKHGCVAVSSGKIIARGCNTYRTFSKDKLIRNCCSCHAEIDVIRKCIKLNIKKKIKLYVVRITENGNYRNSAPCNMCLHILKENNVHTIIYSTNEGTLQKYKLIEYTNIHKSGGQKAIENKRVIFKKSGNYFVFKENT